MSRRVDDIEEDALDEQQRMVWDHVMRGGSCFLTGCGGTGKSYLTSRIIAALQKKHGSSHVAVTASTGIAAGHLGGTTLHSFAGVGLGEEPLERLLGKVSKNADAVDRWKQTKCLVVDEISMIDGHFFDKLDSVARRIRRRYEEPFGGMQLFLVGDFLQLPPVSRRIVSPTPVPQPIFCFESKVWPKVVTLTVELKHVFRQTRDDGGEFIDMLSKLRRGICTPEMTKTLQATRDNDSLVHPLRLFCRNADVDAINMRELSLLPGRAFSLIARDTGEPQYIEQLDKNCLAPKVLYLKVGALVMLLKNIDLFAGLCNGARGVVQSISDSAVVVRFEEMGTIISLKQEAFKMEILGDPVACRKQFPLRLAYAITVHKSQGMTISSAEMSLSDVFEHGQAYVALSRVVGLKGLRLIDFRMSSVRAHPRVLQFYDSL